MSEISLRNQDLNENLIINGAMDYRQRSSGGQTVTASYSYRVQDRFLTKVNDAGDFIGLSQGPTNLTDVDGISYSAMNASIQAANVNAKYYIQQRIESGSASRLTSKQGSFSFEFTNKNFTDVTINFYSLTIKDDHATQVLIDSKSETFIADLTTKKMKFEGVVFPATSGNGLAIEIVISGISIIAGNDNPISKFMLNEGRFAEEFVRAGGNKGQELELCQRYYEVGDFKFNQGAAGSVAQSSGIGGAVPFIAPKRDTAVIVRSDTLTENVNTLSANSLGQGIDFNGRCQGSSRFRWAGTWTADAEL